MIYNRFRPIKDKNNLFIPTYTYRTLKKLNKVIPNSHYIIADFDSLREAESARIGINAPVVSTKLEKSDEKLDYSDYLVPRGVADIFFPTDFSMLKDMHQSITGRDGTFIKTRDFVEEHSYSSWGITKSGYNPLKDDFLNTSFFLTKV